MNWPVSQGNGNDAMNTSLSWKNVDFVGLYSRDIYMYVIEKMYIFYLLFIKHFHMREIYLYQEMCKCNPIDT